MNIKHDYFDPSVSGEDVRKIIKRCEDRMNVSYYKYGAARDNFGGGRVDAIGCLELCLEKFKKTGNNEYLHDAINYAIFRILFPFPGEFFKATDSGESAGIIGKSVVEEDENYFKR